MKVRRPFGSKVLTVVKSSRSDKPTAEDSEYCRRIGKPETLFIFQSKNKVSSRFSLKSIHWRLPLIGALSRDGQTDWGWILQRWFWSKIASIGNGVARLNLPRQWRFELLGRQSWVMTVPFPSFFVSSVKLSCQCDPRTNLLFWMVYACKAAATTALTCAKRATRGLCTGQAISASRLWGALFHRIATCSPLWDPILG